MRTITNDMIFTSVMRAYNKGTLAAQAKKRDGRQGALLLTDGTRCAIGAVLHMSEIKTALTLRNMSAPFQMDESGLVKFENLGYASRVQMAHDSWAHATGSKNRHFKRHDFLRIVRAGVNQ